MISESTSRGQGGKPKKDVLMGSYYVNSGGSILLEISGGQSRMHPGLNLSRGNVAGILIHQLFSAFG